LLSNLRALAAEMTGPRSFMAEPVELLMVGARTGMLEELAETLANPMSRPVG